MALNDKQRHLAHAKANGLTDLKACKEAGYSAKTPQAAGTQVGRMMKNVEFVAYLDKLRQDSRTEAVMTLIERKEWLSKAVRTPLSELDGKSPLIVEKTTTEQGEKIKKADPLRAIDMLNRLDGDYAAEKHEHTVSSVKDIIGEIRNKNAS